MNIQPINSTYQQPNFNAKKLPSLKVKPRLTAQEKQERNFSQAIILAAAFCIASLTKYFIDTFNTKHKNIPQTEAAVTKTDTTNDRDTAGFNVIY